MLSSTNLPSKSSQKIYVNGVSKDGILSTLVRFIQFVAKAHRHLYRDAGIFLVSNRIVVFHFLASKLVCNDLSHTTKNLVVFHCWSCIHSQILFSLYVSPASEDAIAATHFSEDSDTIFAAEEVSLYIIGLILCFLRK